MHVQRRAVIMAAIGTTFLCPITTLSAEPSEIGAVDPIEAGFREPPASARPRVWWHWMNGNITEDGIAKDLAWMKRVGIGGVQNFDAALATPQIVDHRLAYMTPEWKRAFRFAVQRADELGLEFGIAASPGWSETGGPWVAPQDGMKKLVWSETVLAGGRHFAGVLALPPSIGGPYQGIPKRKEAHEAGAPPQFYKDALVIAYRVPASTAPARPTQATANGAVVEAGSLLDDDLATGLPLPGKTATSAGTMAFSYARPQTVSSATVYVTNQSALTPFGRLIPRLQASDDGATWRTLSELTLTAVPTTVSFAPVKARHFRLLFASGKGMDTSAFAPAPGVDISGLASGQTKADAPTIIADFQLFSAPRVNAVEQKAGYAIADDYYALDASTGPDVPGVSPDTVIDITDRMTGNGRLDWTPPGGRWKVLRLGYSLTGVTNHPATAEATGLEVDKYDARAVAAYLDTYLGMYRETVGDTLIGKRGLGAIVTDSTEVGASNWTPQILTQFQRLRGYDPRPWLPALTGEIVGSRRQSDGFLYDFRRTLADLMASEHYGTVARIAHANGLKVYGESLEGQRGLASLGDDIDMRSHADVPMGAMWTFGKGKQPAARFVADLRGAASTAHFYGRPLVASETLTSIFAPWGHAPSDLQPMIDAAFLNGVNRPIIHTSVHQPVDDKVPGLALNAFGQYFNRHETWAEMAIPWMDYVARTSFLLQQGHNVADVAYFYGEEAPVGVLMSNGAIQGLPKRYAYDFVSADGVLGGLSVEGGDLVSSGGARYKALYLGGASSRMTVRMLERLAALAEAGATIVGNAPKSSPGLKDDPARFAGLVNRLWAGGRTTVVGKGRVISGADVEQALADIAVRPDFDYRTAQPADVQFVHRRIDQSDLYFISNRADSTQQVEARFRVTGKAPEIWHADTGKTEPAAYRIEGGETIVPLDMMAGQSLFVAFRKAAATPSRTIATPVFTAIAELGGSWDVAFPPNRGAPTNTRLASLASLSEQQDAGIRYFSGIATYTKSFQLPKEAKAGASLMLDLGRVGDIAEVRVNGQPAGAAWKAPYRVDIGALIRPGQNRLEVRVANLWVNRLIGDAQQGAQKIAYTSLKTYTPRAPLRPSGLIGPVRLMMDGTIRLSRTTREWGNGIVRQRISSFRKMR